MRVVIWVVEDSWKATVAAAAEFLPEGADITIVHVSASEPESVARGALHSLLGRPRSSQPQSLDAISAEAQQELLAEAQAELGHDAGAQALTGRVATEVVAAAQNADLLLMARDGARAQAGPRSLGPTARFVVEHAPCAVLLIWPDYD
jgi:nucleotide-binding universal stress UspA family protein